MRLLAPENRNRLYFGLILIMFLSVASFALAFTKATKDYISDVGQSAQYGEFESTKNKQLDEDL